MNKKNKYRRVVTIVILVMLVILAALPFVINEYVISSAEPAIVKEVKSEQEISLDEDEELRLKALKADCILVLGAGLKPDGTPNHMLEDRLKVGLALYEAEVAPKLLLTGDNGEYDYDEVNAMKQYMLDYGVAGEDIFLDHAGFSTYESMYRAKDIYEVETVIVVTQKYHQYRALFLAEKLGCEAYGVCSDQRTYIGQQMRDIREILARNKDFFMIIMKPEPTYLGEAIPISGDALESWDKD